MSNYPDYLDKNYFELFNFLNTPVLNVHARLLNLPNYAQTLVHSAQAQAHSALNNAPEFVNSEYEQELKRLKLELEPVRERNKAYLPNPTGYSGIGAYERLKPAVIPVCFCFDQKVAPVLANVLNGLIYNADAKSVYHIHCLVTEVDAYSEQKIAELIGPSWAELDKLFAQGQAEQVTAGQGQVQASPEVKNPAQASLPTAPADLLKLATAEPELKQAFFNPDHPLLELALGPSAALRQLFKPLQASDWEQAKDFYRHYQGDKVYLRDKQLDLSQLEALGTDAGNSSAGAFSNGVFSNDALNPGAFGSNQLTALSNEQIDALIAETLTTAATHIYSSVNRSVVLEDGRRVPQFTIQFHHLDHTITDGQASADDSKANPENQPTTQAHVAGSAQANSAPAEQGTKKVNLHQLHNPSLYISKATYLRFFIPEVLPHYQKVVYLDVDINLNHDLRDLYEVALGEHVLAGVYDVFILRHVLNAPHAEETSHYSRYIRRYLGMGLNNYFNAGILVLNIEALHRIKQATGEDFFTEYDRLSKWLHFGNNDVNAEAKVAVLKHQDQCVINSFVHRHGGVTLLDLAWNQSNKMTGDTIGEGRRLFQEESLVNLGAPIWHSVGADSLYQRLKFRDEPDLLAPIRNLLAQTVSEFEPIVANGEPVKLASPKITTPLKAPTTIEAALALRGRLAGAWQFLRGQSLENHAGIPTGLARIWADVKTEMAAFKRQLKARGYSLAQWQAECQQADALYAKYGYVPLTEQTSPQGAAQFSGESQAVGVTGALADASASLTNTSATSVSPSASEGVISLADWNEFTQHSQAYVAYVTQKANQTKVIHINTTSSLDPAETQRLDKIMAALDAEADALAHDRYGNLLVACDYLDGKVYTWRKGETPIASVSSRQLTNSQPARANSSLVALSPQTDNSAADTCLSQQQSGLSSDAASGQASATSQSSQRVGVSTVLTKAGAESYPGYCPRVDLADQAYLADWQARAQDHLTYHQAYHYGVEQLPNPFATSGFCAHTAVQLAQLSPVLYGLKHEDGTLFTLRLCQFITHYTGEGKPWMNTWLLLENDVVWGAYRLLQGDLGLSSSYILGKMLMGVNSFNRPQHEFNNIYSDLDFLWEYENRKRQAAGYPAYKVAGDSQLLYLLQISQRIDHTKEDWLRNLLKNYAHYLQQYLAAVGNFTQVKALAEGFTEPDVELRKYLETPFYHWLVAKTKQVQA